jgi:NAD(P)-dependent dehydrogenase (short-subunit alcohol dehydrogenase family)
MLLENKNAVIYGGGGAIGGAVARAFAREGMRLPNAAHESRLWRIRTGASR